MIIWEFSHPKFGAPSCSYVDVYEHLGDNIWWTQYNTPVWISDMDEEYLKAAIKFMTGSKKFQGYWLYRRTNRESILPYLLKELERKQSRREKEARSCNVPPVPACYPYPAPDGKWTNRYNQV